MVNPVLALRCESMYEGNDGSTYRCEGYFGHCTPAAETLHHIRLGGGVTEWASSDPRASTADLADEAGANDESLLMMPLWATSVPPGPDGVMLHLDTPRVGLAIGVGETCVSITVMRPGEVLATLDIPAEAIAALRHMLMEHAPADLAALRAEQAKTYGADGGS